MGFVLFGSVGFAAVLIRLCIDAGQCKWYVLPVSLVHLCMLQFVLYGECGGEIAMHSHKGPV